MWDERYLTPDYVFGTEPAAFLRHRAGVLPASARVLCIADGEGRNSVHLAGLGHDVVAMDGSQVALAKARALAAARGVTVAFHHADVQGWDWAPEAFDAVIGVFIQFAPPVLRGWMHARIAETLRPGGLVLLHGYGPRQIGYGTGGPRDVTHLYTPDGLRNDFPGWEVTVAEDHDADLAEGSRHVGRSALVDFVARKPAAG